MNSLKAKISVALCCIAAALALCALGACSVQVEGPVASEPAVESKSQEAVPAPEPEPEPAPAVDGTLTVRFIDVGQGDCALVTCGDQNMLIDGGSSKNSSKVYAILKRLGISKLDYIIASHPDADHIGGISGALNYASVGTFYCSATEHSTKTFNSMTKYLAQQDVNITVPAVGDSFQLGQATVTFVGPVGMSGDGNNGSLVARIDFGQSSFLFTGDAEFESESSMLSAGANLKADVLKVAHHGSASSTSARFLSAVQPQCAVVSVGRNNYGHPTDEVLGRLGSSGAEVLRTDKLGSVIFKSDGKTLTHYAVKGNIIE